MSALALALLLSVEPVPKLTGPVVDLAGMIDEGHRAQLEQLARAARNQNEGRGIQLQILTVPTIDDEPIEDFSIRVAEDWKIGSKGVDNGILIVVAKAQRRFRIEVGGGLEGDLTDIQAKRILDDTLQPAFVRGDYGGGLYSAAVAALTAVHGLPQEALRTPGLGPPPFRPQNPIGFGGLLLSLLLFFFGSAGGFALLALLVFIFFLSTRLRGYGGYGGWRGGGGRIFGRRGVGRLVMKVDEFFDEAARARVAEAVKAAEARTTGQIVPVVVARSGHYWRRLFLFNVVLVFFPVFFVVLSGSAPLLSALFGALVVGVLVAALWQLLYSIFPKWFQRSRFEVAVRRRALRAFREHGVHETHEQNGVLLFASLHERKVVVLGDRAVHEKLGDDHWRRAVETLVAGIKAGDPASGFCTAIADIGDEMAKAFPRGDSSQPNEISDELRLDR